MMISSRKETTIDHLLPKRRASGTYVWLLLVLLSGMMSFGWSRAAQADDRYSCHQWAVSQTGFDPTQPPGGAPEAQKVEKRADYQRAMGACLDGRGYTVK